MALRVPLFSPKFHRKAFKFQGSPSFAATSFNSRGYSQISCTKNISDAEIAADLAAEMARVKTPLVQRNEAMNKSRELLFGEFCQYLGLKPEEVKQRWRKMDEVEKMGLVKGFVSEWSLAFHPLSSRSVKEMVEEHLKEENPFVVSSPSLMFPRLKKMLGFSQDKQNGM
ncbi:hypothetical protein BVC80_8933g4 [Macleaya cordata]|uniref:DUF7026 domain-containing protein n=1 Tax=Macleaya cordata TaxID=56857 RepID=A0A200R8A4_MACCD|nr:hypothetical protein BVC80_8933g4 [Macleaya cordata]